jgi:hypothetical protein
MIELAISVHGKIMARSWRCALQAASLPHARNSRVNDNVGKDMYTKTSLAMEDWP